VGVQNSETNMVHYECHTCAMSATCVATSSSSLAWLDHMAIHADPRNFSQWTWMVQALPFD